MSADDFKAQATNQSIGATSIPSEESFGTATIALREKITLSSGIVSLASFTNNSSFAFTRGFTITSGIASSEYFHGDNTFSQNSSLSLTPIEYVLNEKSIDSPSLLSSIGITLSPIDTTESLPSATASNVAYISFSGNGISSLESLGSHTFNSISFIEQYSAIPSSTNINNNHTISREYTLYPSSISPTVVFQNDNYFGSLVGIVVTTGIPTGFSSPINSTIAPLGTLQNILIGTGITSREFFGRRITFSPPPPSFLRNGFIFGYTAIVNNIFVTLERENILDTITRIPRRIENVQSKSQSINGFIESKNTLDSNIDVVYSIEGEIVQEQTVIARQTKYFLESYIKQKNKITSNIYVDENNNYFNRRDGKIN